MKYSKLFGKTSFGKSGGSQLVSNNFLTKGGFIAESTAGRYYFLPLGWRVHENIKTIIKQEMDAVGGQEMISPVLHPIELWQETNRTSSAGFELMSIKDGRGAGFALGGTAEEMFVDLVRKTKLSYRDLPFNLYQFSTKFRDELRARGGLLRVREFVMKDAYSFDVDEQSFLKVYETMASVYTRIFMRLGLKTLKVEADNGYIGGEYCHEFQVESPVGEGRFFVSADGTYTTHEDVAKFLRDPKNVDDPLKPYAEVDAKRGTTMEDGVKLHGLPLWQQIKDFMAVDEKGRMILAVIRGDYNVNETKLAKLVHAHHLRHATVEEIHAISSEPGFISPVGLKGKVLIVGDTSLRTIRNAYGGANKLHRDALNMNIDRDYTLDIEGDIAMAQDGFAAENGKGKLVEKRGIEVGNIFQLGHHYTNLMKGAVFIDRDGKEKPYYMGCYGIGIGRTMAAIVEMHNDQKGIIWPEAVAPYRIHLVSLPGGEAMAQNVYNELTKEGIDTLWDDRDVSAGIKFSDADLIGIPTRLVVSAKTGDKMEVKKRNETTTALMKLEQLIKLI
ncbi:proline--tRNA ligase [Candidatus Gottesmanbacteria bacterium]|nr:proline--tRNA ligase [Candidatus Gottesmanbacteria bacterium]